MVLLRYRYNTVYREDFQKKCRVSFIFETCSSFISYRDKKKLQQIVIDYFPHLFVFTKYTTRFHVFIITKDRDRKIQ